MSRPSSTPPAFQRSRRTNDPLALPAGVSGVSGDGRRWRDLTRHYVAALGARAADEALRVQVGALVSCTLRLERLQRELLLGEPVEPNKLIQLAQTIRCLIKDLGVAQAPNGENVATLREHIASGAA